MMAFKEQQQLCLKWGHHQRNVFEVFSKLLSTEALTDVILVADGCILKAHKVILMACSDYFESLFLNFNEKNQMIILKDIAFSDMAAAVEFMYRGEVNIPHQQLHSLLKTADHLKIKGLQEVSANSSPTLRRSPKAEHPSKSVNQAAQQATGKRKRGRPRLLDSPNEAPDPCFTPRIESVRTLSKRNKTDDETESDKEAADKSQGADDAGDEPKSYADVMKKLGTMTIIKSKDYLINGTRNQFWEEPYVKLLLQAVKNKHLDMKSAADKLGVSYGTLYGRYRELFGYLKQGWTASHNPSRSKPSTNPNIDVPMVDEKLILDQVAKGNLSMTEAAEALSLEPSSVAYHLSSRDTLNGFQLKEEEQSMTDDKDGVDLDLVPEVVMVNDEDESS